MLAVCVFVCYFVFFPFLKFTCIMCYSRFKIYEPITLPKPIWPIFTITSDNSWGLLNSNFIFFVMIVYNKEMTIFYFLVARVLVNIAYVYVPWQIYDYSSIYFCKLNNKSTRNFQKRVTSPRILSWMSWSLPSTSFAVLNFPL